MKITEGIRIAKAKKDAVYLNVYMFREEFGRNKSVTTEKTINKYIDEMKKKLKK